MAHVIGTIRIEAPLEQVFDTAADSRNEPSFNPAMTQVELLTPEPIGLGSRGKAGMNMLVELTEFDRPRRLGSVTTSSMMETSGTLSFTPRCWGDGDGLGLAGTPQGMVPAARALGATDRRTHGTQHLDRTEPARRGRKPAAPA